MSRPKRILTIGHSYVVASNRVTVAAINQMPEYEVTVAAPASWDGDLRSLDCEPEQHGLNLVTLPAYLSQKVHFFWYGNLKELIKPGSFDLIHCWEEPYIVAGYQIVKSAKRAGIPVFFRTAQSLNKNYPFPFSWFESFCTKNMTGWMAGASLVHKNLVARGYPAENSSVINLAVSADQFKPLNGNRKVFSAIPTEEPIIGFVGRLAEEKGLDVIMKALESIPQPWHLVCLGSGPYEDKIRSWASEHGLNDHVHTQLVSHDEVPQYLCEFDVMLAPSLTMSNWKEQFGRMIIEAFACAVPVIGSDSGEIPYVIDDAGLVVPEGDAGRLRESLLVLLRDVEKRKSFGKKGFDRFNSRYTAQKSAEKLASFYGQLIDSSAS